MIPCCCKGLWRDIESLSEPTKGVKNISPYHLKHILYFVLVLWVAFVLWRIDKERQAVEAYGKEGENTATSIVETIAETIERKTAHVLISYGVIPLSIPMMIYMIYSMFTTKIDDNGECPLGYKAGMTSGEEAVANILSENATPRSEEEARAQLEPPPLPPFPSHLKRKAN
ncbi:hypothetical protein AAMO2058_001104100 [Amorphochlora amoebiformis]